MKAQCAGLLHHRVLQIKVASDFYWPPQHVSQVKRVKWNQNRNKKILTSYFGFDRFTFCFPDLHIKMSNKLQTLLKWFEDNKIEWDKDALEIKESNGSFGVHAKKSMKKDKPGKRKKRNPLIVIIDVMLTCYAMSSCKDSQRVHSLHQDHRYRQSLGWSQLGRWMPSCIGCLVRNCSRRAISLVWLLAGTSWTWRRLAHLLGGARKGLVPWHWNGVCRSQWFGTVAHYSGIASHR